ncbi:L-lactate permease [Rufibacter ruber]|uniref:L-lactate permease n=1 Tax=Rufibacter ruber TaxID=1783499 RepID=UPI000835D639|nr:L-lactate permease [Rufibacter ruber]
MFLLALLPIAVLILFSLLRSVREAALLGLVVTSGLFFYWGAPVAQYLAVMGVSVVSTLNILMIVFGALFLYNVMQGTGLVEQIGQSLEQIHPSKEIRFFLLALGLTAFFEGVAGFGTPGAIVPLLLMAMGYDALVSVAVVLLFDGLFAIFGAVGTPLLTGMQHPLRLPPDQVRQIGLWAAVIGVLVQGALLFFVFRFLRNAQAPVRHKAQVWVLFSFFAVPFCGFAWWVTDLATVLAALAMLLLSVLYLRSKGTRLQVGPWVPYVLLAGLLLLPKLWGGLQQVLGWELRFHHLFGTGISTGLRPLLSPLFPFLLVGGAVALYQKSRTFYLAEAGKKTAMVSLVLFPSIMIAQLMIHSGGVQPSMVNYISGMMGRLQGGYVLFSPFLGILGAFITGSTTVSNVVFAPSQLETAQLLKVNPTVILALQLVGAGLGNAICLFNIVAAASIANLKDYKEVLRLNLLPALVAGFLAGALGWLLLWLL